MNIRIASLALAATAMTTMMAMTAGLAPSASAAPAAHPSSDTVKVETGVLKGMRVNSETTAFLGVPYAAPPVGPLRFREPQPAAAWRGVRPAVTEPKGCISTSVGPDRSEDCLYLNIFAPAKAPPSGRRWPVLFWTPGGNGRIGGGFDGARLAAKGAVVVLANRRIGVLAALSLPELAAESPNRTSGNQGRLDLIMGLKWVRTNIAAFGGDPRNVTMAGFSGGALSTAALQTSPLAKGLYNKVMAESGTVFGNDVELIKTMPEAEDLGRRVLEAAGVKDLAALRALPPDFVTLPAVRSLGTLAVVTIDGYMLKEHPRDAFMAGRVNEVPALLGSSSGENDSAVISDVKSLADLDAKLAIRFADDPAGLVEVRSLYPASSDAEAIWQARKMNTDADVVARMRTWAFRLASKSRAPVWLYTMNMPVGGDGVANHGDDVAFWFCTMDMASPGQTPNNSPADYALCDRMMDAEVAFLRSGNPNTAAVHWPRYDPTAERMIEFNEPSDKATTVSPGVQFFARKAMALFGREY